MKLMQLNHTPYIPLYLVSMYESQFKVIEVAYFMSFFVYNKPVWDINKMKPRIHQFTNLKCCKMSFKAFKMKKQGLKCFQNKINKK